MKIEIKRMVFTDEATIGELSLDGKFFCFCLEDSVRSKKIPGKTAIPAGTYEVIITYSNRFKRPMPLLVDVPGFSGIRIHQGNTEKDTDGCILLGKEKYVNQIGESRQAFDEFFPKLEESVKIGEAMINIVGGSTQKGA